MKNKKETVSKIIETVSHSCFYLLVVKALLSDTCILKKTDRYLLFS